MTWHVHRIPDLPWRNPQSNGVPPSPLRRPSAGQLASCRCPSSDCRRRRRQSASDDNNSRCDRNVSRRATVNFEESQTVWRSKTEARPSSLHCDERQPTSPYPSCFYCEQQTNAVGGMRQKRAIFGEKNRKVSLHTDRHRRHLWNDPPFTTGGGALIKLNAFLQRITDVYGQ